MISIYNTIIKASRQLGFLWLCSAVHPYKSVLLISPLDSIKCLYRADEYKFSLNVVYVFLITSISTLAHLAGAVEYTNCFSAEE